MLKKAAIKVRRSLKHKISYCGILVVAFNCRGWWCGGTKLND
jgi:hypothetical protein